VRLPIMRPDLFSRAASAVESGTFRLRKLGGPIEGPIPALGSCLSPIILDGDRVWLDPVSVPMSGDLVWLRFNQRAMHNMLSNIRAGAAAGNPIDVRWLETYGQDVSPNCLKLYHEIDGKPWLAISPAEAARDEAPSLLPLTDEYFDGGILGIVSHVERDGRLIYSED
jgi:hypothetical protein